MVCTTRIDLDSIQSFDLHAYDNLLHEDDYTVEWDRASGGFATQVFHILSPSAYSSPLD